MGIELPEPEFMVESHSVRVGPLKIVVVNQASTGPGGVDSAGERWVVNAPRGDSTMPWGSHEARHTRSYDTADEAKEAAVELGHAILTFQSETQAARNKLVEVYTRICTTDVSRW